MADELTQEEKDAAAQLEAEAGKEKTSLEKIGDGLSEVTDLLKSHVEKDKEEIVDDPKEEPIDFENIDPVEMAKSFAEDQEKAKDFIAKFTESCGLNPQDMVDTEGVPYIDEEMMKSLEDAERNGDKYLAGILYSLQETNSRNAVKDNVMMQTQVMLAKSMTDILEVVTEMQKSMKKEESEEVVEDNDGGGTMPTLDSEDPITNLDAGMSKGIEKEDFMKALKNTFFKSFGDTADEAKYHEYADFASKMPPEAVLSLMEQGDRDLVEANLLPS